MTDGLLVLQAAADTATAYRDFPVIGSRAAIWIAAEIHLMFAAFVLGVPIFAVVAEHECRSEEHTSELQSQSNLVCRLLLEKKNNKHTTLQSTRPPRSLP